MSNLMDYIYPILSGILVSASSFLPTSPESFVMGNLLVKLRGTGFIVPAYLGVMFAVVFYFRNKLEQSSKNAMRGIFEAELRYIFYASMFTLLLGYPLIRFGTPFDSQTSDFVNVLIGVALILIGLSNGRFQNPIKVWGRRIRDEKNEPSLLDSVISGFLQGITFVEGFSRSGFVLLGLVLSGIDVKKALELSFLIVPAYMILKLVSVGCWISAPGISSSFVAFLASFVSAILIMKGLIFLAERMDSKEFLVLFGGTALLVYLLGVIL